jgi:hypothetical protein
VPRIGSPGVEGEVTDEVDKRRGACTASEIRQFFLVPRRDVQKARRELSGVHYRRRRVG